MESSSRSTAGVSNEHGFTLLELLVVFFIVALLSGLAVVSIRGNDPQGAVKEEGRKIKELLELVSREALFSFRDMGVRFTNNGFSFWTQNEAGQWVMLKGDDLLRERVLPEGMIFSVWAEDVPVDLPEKMDKENRITQGEGPKPHLFFFSSGERIPFRIRITAHSGVLGEVVGGLVGELKIESPES
ncbi:MAG: ral secretion pathway protein H [Magnetococcales bacterium]|nr:ral secretion pathway protein H [Magnetococcales bacterium]